MPFDILLCFVTKTRWKSYFDQVFVYDRPTSLISHLTRLIDEILNNNRSVKPAIELMNNVFRVFVWRVRKGTQLIIVELATESDINNLFCEILEIGMTLIKKETTQLIVSMKIVSQNFWESHCSAAIGPSKNHVTANSEIQLRDQL